MHDAEDDYSQDQYEQEAQGARKNLNDEMMNDNVSHEHTHSNSSDDEGHTKKKRSKSKSKSKLPAGTNS